MPILAPHRLFTVAEYHRMIDAGVLTKDDRCELIGGEIIAVSPMGNRHAWTLSALTNRLARLVPETLLVGVQLPIILSEHDEPEPDLHLRQVAPSRVGLKAVASEVVLVVEVADSSLDFDRHEKLPRYARAGIPTCWLIDLTADQVEILTAPGGDGYGQRQVRARGGDLPVPTGGSLALDTILP